MTAKWCKVSFWGDEDVLNLIVEMAVQLREYTKTIKLQTKWVDYSVCEYYPNKASYKKKCRFKLDTRRTDFDIRELTLGSNFACAINYLYHLQFPHLPN